jgi:hypothetical protein
MGLAQSKQDCAPCYFSKPCGEYEIEKNALDGNRLVAELTISKPRDDDYLGQSQAILDSHKCVKENGSVGSARDFFSSNASDYVPIDKAGDALIGETVGGLRNGYVCALL